MDLVNTSTPYLAAQDGPPFQILLFQILNLLQTNHNTTVQHTESLRHCVERAELQEKYKNQEIRHLQKENSKLSNDYLTLQNLYRISGKHIDDLEESLKKYEEKVSEFETQIEEENMARVVCERDLKKAHNDLMNRELYQTRNFSRNIDENMRQILATLQLMSQNQSIEYQKQISYLENRNEELSKEIQDLRKFKEENSCHSTHGLELLSTPGKVPNWQGALNRRFAPGSKVVIRGKSGVIGSSINFYLKSSDITALLVSNRWCYGDSGHRVVLNTYKEYWGEEVIIRPEAIYQREEFVVTIQCLENGMKVCINNNFVEYYTHRFPPDLIDEVAIMNAEEISSIYYYGHI